MVDLLVYEGEVLWEMLIVWFFLFDLYDIFNFGEFGE